MGHFYERCEESCYENCKVIFTQMQQAFHLYRFFLPNIVLLS